jgi:hypothetical protein
MASQDVPTKGDRWLLALGYGLLAEVATIITIVLVVMLYKYVVAPGLSDADYASFGERVGAMIGIVGGTLYTFGFARRLMRKISSHFIAHGIVVAVAAIALSVGGSIAGHQSAPAGYLLASALKIIAGALAAFLHQRSAIRAVLASR